MTVETNANYISDFNKAYPRNRDLIKEGDDHIRLVKSVLQNTFPGMNKAVTPDSDKLNKLDATFEYEGSNLGINNSFTVAKDRDLDFGGNVLSNIGDPEDPTDAVNLRSLQGSLMWPVGSIFITVDSRNPNTILGFGTWEKFAAGRVLIGTGTTTDSDNVSRTFVNEAKGGTFTKKLVEDNVPSHAHKITDQKTGEGGLHSHNVSVRIHDYALVGGNSWTVPHGDIAGENKRFQSSIGPKTNDAPNHSHTVSGTTDEYGKGEAFDISTPYIACNMWLRKPDKEPTP